MPKLVIPLLSIWLRGKKWVSKALTLFSFYNNIIHIVATLYFDNMIDTPYEILYDMCNSQSGNGILQEIFPYVTGIPTIGKMRIQTYGKRTCKS